MGRRTGGRRAAPLGGLLAAVLALGLLTAPPAHAAGQIDEAAEALADGPGVWVADGFEGASDELVALMRARFARAETPVRVAMVTEELGEDDAAAQRFASAVGEPGAYLVYGETDDPASDSPTTDEQWAALGGVTYDDIYDEDMDRLGIGVGSFPLSLPDALDGDLAPEVAALPDDAPFFVDPAVTDVFPGIDAELLSGTFADVETPVRVAVVTALGGDESAVQESFFDGLPQDGTAVLLRWEDDDFSVTTGTGAAAPFGVDDVTTLVGGIGIGEVPPGLLPQRLALLASLLGPDPVEVARSALVDDPVYVHPGVSDGETDAAEVDALRERLRAADPAARAAFMPEELLELRLGEDAPESGTPEFAGMFVPDGGAGTPGTDVVVWTVSSELTGYVSDVSATGSASFVAATEWTQGETPAIAGPLEAVLAELDGGGGGPGAALPDALGDTGQLRVYLLVMLGIAVLWLGPVVLANSSRRRRRVRAVTKWRRRLSRLPASQARQEQERADIAAAALWPDLVRLGDDIAQVPAPAHPARLRALQRIRGEYERLLAAHDEAVTWHEVALVRRDAQRLRQALTVWLRTADPRPSVPAS